MREKKSQSNNLMPINAATAAAMITILIFALYTDIIETLSS